MANSQKKSKATSAPVSFSIKGAIKRNEEKSVLNTEDAQEVKFVEVVNETVINEQPQKETEVKEETPQTETHITEKEQDQESDKGINPSSFVGVIENSNSNIQVIQQAIPDFSVDEISEKAKRLVLLDDKKKQSERQLSQLERFKISHDQDNVEIIIREKTPGGATIGSSNPVAVGLYINLAIEQGYKNLAETKQQIKNEFYKLPATL